MSPGATFERVYHELKRMLAEGELPPGTPIEPALIGRQIASSITPIRDALHRLAGERLVEAPNHNGFRVPHLSESGLRDLYEWNGELLALAVRARARTLNTPLPTTMPEDVHAQTAELFAAIARATGLGEHAWTIELLSARLAPFRRAEARVLDGLNKEFASLAAAVGADDRAQLRRLLASYHRRRIKAVSLILSGRASSRKSGECG